MEDSARSAVSVDDKVYGITFPGAKMYFYLYNKDIFSRLGLEAPVTYEEFRTVCQTIQDSGTTPIYEATTNGWHQVLPLFETGGLWLADDPEIYNKLNANEVDLDSIPHLLNIITELDECAKAGYFGDDYLSNAWENAKEAIATEPVSYTHLVSQYTCSQYSKVPVGKLCTTQHRINEDVVLSLISDMLKAIAEYARHDRAEFIQVVQEAQSSQQTAEVRKQRTRLATAKQRVSELEVLLCKIYEDNILGKLSDSRYEMLDAQYAKEQSELTTEISALEKAVKGYEKHEKDADRFIALIDKYENFDKLTVTMLNEFVEKILVHERDRKGSRDTTQEVEIYFNFVGRFVPPAFGEVELTSAELEEIRKKEERKDRLHQNYLKRKANGKQKEYEERTKAKKKAEIEARKAAIRTEDIAKGVFIPVSSLPQREPQKGAKTA